MNLISKLFNNFLPKEKSNYKVSIDDQEVLLHHSSNGDLRIRWDEIIEIRILIKYSNSRTNHAFMQLIGKDKSCIIPKNAEGYEAVRCIVSKYPDFAQQNYTYALDSSEDQQFLIWNRQG